jgi:hypothetical protein
MPVFMIGTQRSGSNLLRLMLNQLPEIAAPHPPHVLERFVPLLPGYGSLRSQERFDLLVDDVCRLVENNPVPWEGVDLDRRAVARRCTERSLVAIYAAIHDLAAAAWGARDWCCKSLANVHYLDEITRFFTAAKFIHLYRDGRDVAVSFRRARVGEKHFYFIANQWDREQRLALSLRATLGPARVFAMSYEGLTAQPQETMQALCDFLGVPYSEVVLSFSSSTEAARTASSGAMWRNVNKPIMRANCCKYRSEASPDEVRIFEKVAGGTLVKLGYTLEGEVAQSGGFIDSEIAVFAEENRRRKAEVYAALTAEELRLLEPQQRLIDEIRARSALAPVAVAP